MIVGDPEGQFNWLWIPPIPIPLDYRVSVTYDQTPIRTASTGSITFTVAGVPIVTATSRDVLMLQGPNAGQWQWMLPEFSLGGSIIGIRSDGVNPFPNGGQGTFTTQIEAVPEPTTLLLLGTGLGGVAIKMRKKLKLSKAGKKL